MFFNNKITIYSCLFSFIYYTFKKYSSIIYEEEQKEEESIWDEAFKKEVFIDYKIIDEIEKNLIIEITEINFI